MSIREKSAYLPECDYPGCGMSYDFWTTTKEDAIETVIDDEDWLCLFTGDNEPRFFCPEHLRYAPYSPYASTTVFYDSDDPAAQTTLDALNKYYTDMGTLQPLPKLECEDTILAVLQKD